MKVIDLHCDTILKCYKRSQALMDMDAHINIPKLIQGGCLAQFFALYIPTEGSEDYVGLEGRMPYELYKDLIACFNKNIADCNAFIKHAYSADDIRRNAYEGFMSAVLSIEDGVALEGKIDRVKEFYDDGVRMLALTWNFDNCIGHANNADPVRHMMGLTDFGRDAVEYMNELGIIIDVSHLSEGGFWDVARISKKPFIASHSCAAALRPHKRALTDNQLKAIADRGGVIGVNFCSEFLSEDRVHTYKKDIVRHLDHMRNVAGIDSLAWGSDFDGILSITDFGGYEGFPLIIDDLSSCFTDDEIDKINSLNFLRVFSEI